MRKIRLSKNLKGRSKLEVHQGAEGISSIALDELVEWTQHRAEYVGKIRAQCQKSGEDPEVLTESVRNSFSESLLETLCEVEWGVAFLLEKIRLITECLASGEMPSVREIFEKELRMDFGMENIKVRVTGYFMLCDEIIKKNRLSPFFSTDRGAEKKRSILVSLLPGRLKRKVENILEFGNEKLIQTVALGLEKEERGAKRAKLENNHRGTAQKREVKDLAPHPSNRATRKLKRAQQSHGGQVTTKGMEIIAEMRLSLQEHKQKIRQRLSCSHCQGPHCVCDCPTATKEYKERLTPKKSGESRSNTEGRHR
uniref:Uncharacterized protein n=1 Tax=Globisporangium ultimum (strain ATCC 200006 / CBS 805.95 / DAOM BR144) TaxID=431595 RepID=K3X3V3_GLOUD